MIAKNRLPSATRPIDSQLMSISGTVNQNYHEIVLISNKILFENPADHSFCLINNSKGSVTLGTPCRNTFSIEFLVAKIFFFQCFLCCVGYYIFQRGSSTFLCRLFGVKNLSYRDILSPVRSGAVTFCHRKIRTCLFYTRDGLISLTNFFIWSFFIENWPVNRKLYEIIWYLV